MTRERRPCACQGSLVADPDSSESVERAVKRHQDEPQHHEWFILEQLAGNYVTPFELATLETVKPTVRRVA